MNLLKLHHQGRHCCPQLRFFLLCIILLACFLGIAKEHKLRMSHNVTTFREVALGFLCGGGAVQDVVNANYASHALEWVQYQGSTH